ILMRTLAPDEDGKSGAGDVLTAETFLEYSEPGAAGERQRRGGFGALQRARLSGMRLDIQANRRRAPDLPAGYAIDLQPLADRIDEIEAALAELVDVSRASNHEG